MSDNIREIRPGVRQPRAGQKESWVLDDNGQWVPVPPHAPEIIKGPFVLAMQAQMQKLVAEAARTNWLDGYWAGLRFLAPFTGAGFVVGFLSALVML